MGWYSYNPKDVVSVYEDEYVAVDYNKSGKMYRVTIYEDGHYKDEYWFDAYEEKEITNKTELIGWLLGEKYITVDENSDSMTEEFEKQHQWELSRNCFINKVIKYIEQMT